MKLINRSLNELNFTNVNYKNKPYVLFCNGLWGDNAQLLLVDNVTEDPVVEIQAFVKNNRISNIWDIVDYATEQSIPSRMITELEAAL